jgi:hypothetical protein
MGHSCRRQARVLGLVSATCTRAPHLASLWLMDTKTTESGHVERLVQQFFLMINRQPDQPPRRPHPAHNLQKTQTRTHTKSMYVHTCDAVRCDSRLRRAQPYPACSRSPTLVVRSASRCRSRKALHVSWHVLVARPLKKCSDVWVAQPLISGAPQAAPGKNQCFVQPQTHRSPPSRASHLGAGSQFSLVC